MERTERSVVKVNNELVCFDISPGESCGFDRVDGDSLARGRGPPPAWARGRGPTQARGRGPVSSQDLPGTGKGASPGAGPPKRHAAGRVTIVKIWFRQGNIKFIEDSQDRNLAAR